MFIQTEQTPNPNAIKFYPDIEVSSKPIYFTNVKDATISTLAQKLFYIEGVTAIFLGQDFITITKNSDTPWNILQPEVYQVISDHFMAGLQAIDNIYEQSASIDKSILSDVEKQIVELIETRVRPSVAMDGGDIVYRGFKDGIVKLELRGSCSGCPSSNITLKNGIESMLQHYVPEVIAVEAVE